MWSCKVKIGSAFRETWETLDSKEVWTNSATCSGKQFKSQIRIFGLIGQSGVSGCRRVVTMLRSRSIRRYVAVDEIGQSIAVAGAHGVAHYSVSSRKWRLFGNESQERALCCVGGLAWWHDLLVVPCTTPDEKYVLTSHSILKNFAFMLHTFQI